MALPWIREAIARTRHEIAVKAWRAVEAQHVVSTLRLTGNNPEEQELLESVLEDSKPPMPARLHYLLATPFRYPPRAHGSRFRAWTDPGVLYAAVERRTACAEMGYWRWKFVQDSERLHEIAASPQTLFQVGARGDAVDLQRPPFDQHIPLWTDAVDYGATQALGLAARVEEIALILYRSVRDPEPGVCVAVLDADALKPKRPLAQETWHLTVTSEGTIWQRERQRWVFDFRCFL